MTKNNKSNKKSNDYKRDLRMTPKAGFTIKRRRLSCGGKYE